MQRLYGVPDGFLEYPCAVEITEEQSPNHPGIRGSGLSYGIKPLVRLRALSPHDKKIFIRFLNLGRHQLAVYAFENIYIWRGLYKISWTVAEDCLCVFFQDNLGCFLYLPPLGKNITPQLLERVFATLDKFNAQPEVSRIENIEEGQLALYQGLGLDCRIKSYDYLYLGRDLVGLRGNKYKSQRAAYNYFRKNYPFVYLPYSQKDLSACLGLYREWQAARKLINQEKIYQAMLEDSRNSLEVALTNYRHLNLGGRIVKIHGKIKAFSFGYRINPDTFCILYEVADLKIKGLAQFIFQRFSADLSAFKYINIMDDSGLENLKRVKLSYHPLKLIPSYIAKRCLA